MSTLTAVKNDLGANYLQLSILDLEFGEKILDFYKNSKGFNFFCSWNCHDDSKGKSSEFVIPYPFLTFLGK